MMFRLLLCFLFVNACYSMFGMPTCKYIYPEVNEDNPVPENMCRYNGYTYSHGTTVWTSYDDCNKCYCRNGILKCCLYGIKSGQIAHPVWCETVRIDGTCNYKVVYKNNRDRLCSDSTSQLRRYILNL